MIFELKPNLGIFVRADKIQEIVISGQFAHVHMESGHCHYVPQNEGHTALEMARDIMDRANKLLNPPDIILGREIEITGAPLDLRNQAYIVPCSETISNRVGESLFPFGATPDHP